MPTGAGGPKGETLSPLVPVSACVSAEPQIRGDFAYIDHDDVTLLTVARAARDAICAKIHLRASAGAFRCASSSLR